ncbi:MAG TPA: hypothetical protein VLV18_09375 [Terriglobales bacterium]|nr:hypothetical protein [Terriglobales bacterium]
MFERHDEPLLPRSAFLRRVLQYAVIAFAIDLGSLGVGVVGYHFLEGLSWIDSLLNAAMILGGEGPVSALHTTAGKVFASFYALYSGLIFLVAAGVLFLPVIHRFLHYFNFDSD